MEAREQTNITFTIIIFNIVWQGQMACIQIFVLLGGIVKVGHFYMHTQIYLVQYLYNSEYPKVFFLFYS